MNMNALLKQARNMQKKVDEISTNFDSKVFEVKDNNGITLKIKGNLEIEQIEISKDLLGEDNQEILQDLLLVTLNKTLKDISEQRNEALNSVTGGVNLGGLF